MPVTKSGATAGTIMLVDDTPANLKLLEDILHKQQYEVLSFPRGRMALTACQNAAPDLILLDVNMPEMTGYEVCEQLKATATLCDVPVIFISAMHATEDIIRGFRAGGADYISKPFQIEEVQARVETHLKLSRALRTERDLLEGTLAGAVAALLELLHTTSPLLVSRSQSVRNIVLFALGNLKLESVWQYELAAMLSLVGCIALPNELFEKAYGHQELTAQEAEIFAAHPQAAATLLSNIPRLEVVTEIIRLQQGGELVDGMAEEVKTGAELLRLSLALDQKIYQDILCPTALLELKDAGQFHPALLQALRHYSPGKVEFDLRQVLVQDVCPGMILDEDVACIPTKFLLFKAGVVFTELWVERLRNFAKIKECRNG